MSQTSDTRPLDKIEKLLTALVKAALREPLAGALQDKKHRLIYENTGKMAVKELAKRTGFSVGKISGIWQEWEQVGLLVKKGNHYEKTI
jgi:hypothetical protein